MKARAKTFLNIRTGKPAVLPDNNTGDRFFNPGDVVDIEAAIIGELFKDSSIWYKLTEGGFVWSGGVITETVLTQDFPWWIHNPLYSLTEIWNQPTKRVIKIAVLDTGISRHQDFDFSKITGFNYLSNSPNFIEDIKGHGTHCTGIIVAQGKQASGVAPDAHVYIAKVCDNAGVPNVIAIKNALTDILLDKNGADNIQMINMSFGMLVRDEVENEIKKEIITLLHKLHTEKNCLLIASSGSVEDRKDSFPSLLNDCIAVGCLSSDFQRHPLSRKTMTLDIMSPGTDITSLNGSDQLATDTGTSQATAFTTGICALVLQKINAGQVGVDILKKALTSTAQSNSFPIEDYGHGIIHPNLFFDSLKNI